jgi:hypothetical protein
MWCPRNNPTVCHSVLDTESTVDTFWIPVLAGKDRNDTGSSVAKSFQRHYTDLVTVSKNRREWVSQLTFRRARVVAICILFMML